MSLRCPACQKSVPAGQVNIGVDLARCTACGEVFRPGATTPPVSQIDDEPPRPTPEPAPEGTKVRIEDQGASLLVRFPPFGFNSAVLFLMIFAAGWWSFLGAFIWIGILDRTRSDPFDHLKELQTQPQTQEAIEAESPSEGQAPAEQEPPDKSGDSTEPESGLDGAFRIMLGLFMLPFLAVGVGVIWEIFSQILRPTRVRLSTDGCSYRRSLLGLGRRRSASLAETSVRWTEESSPPGPGASGESAKPSSSTRRCEPHILLALGSWAIPIGGHLSLHEQKWVFREMRTWLKRYAVRESRPRGG